MKAMKAMKQGRSLSMTAMKASTGMKQQSSFGQNVGRKHRRGALGSEGEKAMKSMKAMKSVKAMKAMKAKPMKAKATKAAKKSRKAGSPPKAMTALKAKARKSVEARSTPQIIKKVMKTKALQKTDTMTKIVGKGDQELWSKVSVKDIPEIWVVTKRDKNEIGHDVYGMLKKKSTFKFP